MSQLFDLYKKVGNANYAKAISEIAPYFATIDTRFVDLRPGYCELILENRREIHNHLGFIHVIAICNAAELAAGVVTDVSIPENHHWIPVAMQTRYLAKAKSDLRVVANAESINWQTLGNIPVTVDAFDKNNSQVFSATIEMLVREKKSQFVDD